MMLIWTVTIKAWLRYIITTGTHQGIRFVIYDLDLTPRSQYFLPPSLKTPDCFLFHVTVLCYLYIYSLSYILVLGLWIMKLAMLNGWRLNIGCRIWRFLSAHRDSRARLGHTGVRLDTVRTSSTDMLIDEEVRSGCRCNRSTFSGECKATPAVRGR